MPNWVESFTNHDIHQTLGNCIEIVDSIIEGGVPSEQHLEDIQRIRTVIKRLELYLSNCDPNLIPNTSHLNNLREYLSNIKSQFDTYNSNKDLSCLNNANAQANSIIGIFPHLHSLKIPSLRGVRENSIEYQREVKKYINQIDEKYQDVLAQYNESTNSFKEVSATTNESIKELNGLFENLDEKYRDEESKRSEQFKETENERSKKFSSEIDSRAETVHEKINEFEKEFDALKNDIKHYKERLNEKLKKEVDDIVVEIKDLRKESQNLVNGVASDTMARDYRKIADEERTIKFIWNLGAIISMIILIIFAFYIFKSVSQENMTWFAFIAKIFTTATIGTMVGYCANQANRYHKSEQFNRKMHLELQAISPYIEGLTYEDKNKIKAKLADRFFGVHQSNIGSTSKKGDNSDNLSPETIKIFKDLIKELKNTP